jgi:hypothetical protein
MVSLGLSVGFETLLPEHVVRPRQQIRITTAAASVAASTVSTSSSA